MYVYRSIRTYMLVSVSIYSYLPMQPLVECHDSVRKRINTAVGLSLPCIVLADELVRQTIKDIRKNEHEFLYVAVSVNNYMSFCKQLYSHEN